jgi:L-ascorbate metabolism protein UlaG (beta-lactamase superfamily)
VSVSTAQCGEQLAVAVEVAWATRRAAVSRSHATTCSLRSDLAVLPVNGSVVNAPHLQPQSMVAAAMGPKEAGQAAAILRAKALLPTHYGAFIPGIYVEQDDAIATLRELAGDTVVTLEPGETLSVAGG